MKISCFIISVLILVAGVAKSSDQLFVELPRTPLNRNVPLNHGRALFPGAPGVIEKVVVSDLPAMFLPDNPRFTYTRYPWKNNIQTTVFWAGEKATPNNPVPNTASSWDPIWSKNFGGYDNPDPKARKGWLPRDFVPKQNPFYVALPFNDVLNSSTTKSTTKKHVPWFKETFYREGRSIVKGRWVAIRQGDKICYGQWEDCGPFETDNWEYVFGDQRPNTKGNGGAGLDVSPAVRDYLGFRYSATCDWRFVELYEIPDGPWKTWGNNNPFVLATGKDRTNNVSQSLDKLRNIKKQFFAEKGSE